MHSKNGEIGRFISQDFSSLHSPEKFLFDPQQLNLYSYVRNNPLNYIDPLGLELRINGTQEYANTTFQSLQQIYSNIVMTKVDNNNNYVVTFREGVKLDNSKSSQLLRQAILPSNVITITMPSDGRNGTSGNSLDAQFKKPTDATIYFAPSDKSATPVYNPKDKKVTWESTPSWLGLAHEMIHGLHLIYGDYTMGGDDYKGVNGKIYKSDNGANNEEVRTVGLGHNRKYEVTENNLRREKGLKLRNNY